MVVAPPDRGKTTLIRLLTFLSLKVKVGWVDSDLGQSNVGPPTTVGMIMSTPFSSRKVIHSYFRFVGDVNQKKG